MPEISVRTIEKLEAIGYSVSETRIFYRGIPVGDFVTGAAHNPMRPWERAHVHSLSPEGMRLTMPDKMAWLSNVFAGFMVTVRRQSGKFHARVVEFRIADAESTEAAVTALFEAVP